MARRDDQGRDEPMRGRQASRERRWGDMSVARRGEGGRRGGRDLVQTLATAAARGAGRASGRGLSGRAWGAIVAVGLAAVGFFGGLGEGWDQGGAGGGGGGPLVAQLDRVDAPFDYYVLAMSWSPEFCRDNPNSDQCGQGRRFILHGLWPQREDGRRLRDCPTDTPRVDRDVLRAVEDAYGSFGLPAYQWRTHGACSGLSPEAYLATSVRAYLSIVTPPTLDAAARDFDADPRALERAMLDANPRLTAPSISVICRDGEFSEMRICLTPDLEPRACGRNVEGDCRASSIDVFAPR